MKIVSLMFAAIFCMNSIPAATTDAAPMAIAHRGAPDFAPENTLASFLIAKAQGADAVECDLHLTADGRLAVVHDDTTGRAWSQDLRVEDSTMNELRSLRPGTGFRSAFPQARTEHIPEFSEVIEALAGTHIFAELKSVGRQAADALYAELERLGAKQTVTVISFSKDTVVYLHGKGIDCALLVEGKTPPELLALDLPHGIALDAECSLLGANTVAALHEQGRRVYCWTVAGGDGFARMRNLGVDGITADNLSFLN